MVYLAHTGGHALDAHLHAVAVMAHGFANQAPCGASMAAWCELAGRWHDLGKYRPGFQRYLSSADGENAHIEGRLAVTAGGRVASRDKTHSVAGALWAIQVFEKSHGKNGALAARVLAWLIASHHAGLYDWAGGLKERLALDDSATELREALAAPPPQRILDAGNFNPVAALQAMPGGATGFALWVRMMFSCLVDADFLDTEAHFDQNKPLQRQGFPALAAMLPAFDAFMQAKAKDAAPTPVNALRADILHQCRAKAALPPGFFTLTVPTGGGKTLSSLAFALTHALHRDKQRVIYAIPYTSIIEQTADQFRAALAALGEDVLIEHHSQAEADESDETARSRLACENWDAPLIVTTNVQLFESLFAAKTSRCRKLHRLMNSVIVLDEAQQLPPEFLQPILDALKLLVAHYGVTVVFCTATQPALTTAHYFDKSKGLKGIEGAREIMDDPDALYRQLDRVRFAWPADFNQPTPWIDVAAQIAQEDCVLAIVNSRKAARELHSLLPKGTLHLSALMCGEHRSDVIKHIKQRLQSKRAGLDSEPLRVVATSLVEAGVDLDFPVVFRALAGLDSIAQAAGRCNREGLLTDEGGTPCKGRVVVYVPPENPPRGLSALGATTSKTLMTGRNGESLERAVFDRYFREIYYHADLDSKGINRLLRVEADFAISFRTAAEKFRLIDDKDSAPVIVRYQPKAQETAHLLAQLQAQGPQRWLMRKLQRSTVTIPLRVANQMLAQGSLMLVTPGTYAQVETDSLYDPSMGLYVEGIAYDPAGYVS